MAGFRGKVAQKNRTLGVPAVGTSKGLNSQTSDPVAGCDHHRPPPCQVPRVFTSFGGFVFLNGKSNLYPILGSMDIWYLFKLMFMVSPLKCLTFISPEKTSIVGFKTFLKMNQNRNLWSTVG